MVFYNINYVKWFDKTQIVYIFTEFCYVFSKLLREEYYNLIMIVDVFVVSL